MIFQHDNAQKVDVSAFITPTMLDINALMEQMTLDPCHCQEIEEATRGQADSKLWLALHNGPVTSSYFGEILHRRENTDAESIARYSKANYEIPESTWIDSSSEMGKRQ